MGPIAWQKNKKATRIIMPLFENAKMVTGLEYQNYLELMEPGYINWSPRDASIISSGGARRTILKEQKRGKGFICLIFNFDWPIVQV